MSSRVFFVLTILLTPQLFAQSNDTEITTESATRAGEIQTERLQKDASIQLATTASRRSSFAKIGSVVTRAPIRVLSEGLGPGAGIGIGSVLEWSGSGDRVVSRVWGLGLLPDYYRVGTGLEVKNFPAHDLGFALTGSYSYAPQLPYYGPGPNSSLQNRTDYLKEDTLFNLAVTLPAYRRMAEACRLGELLVNVGPGTDGSIPSTESVFGPAQAPGIDVQSNFLIGGCSAEMDLRDYPGDPHKGTYAAAAYDRYYAQGHNQFSFHRLSAVAEQYLPFWNEKRFISLRAKTILSFHTSDQVVPFYLQATLGNDTDLRGFRRYRFYDENSIVFNAEYHWEIGTGFDWVLFSDFGKVFHKPGEISFSNLEGSAGFGFRIRDRDRVLARFDTGFSREGVQVWLKFGKLF